MALQAQDILNAFIYNFLHYPQRNCNLPSALTRTIYGDKAVPGLHPGQGQVSNISNLVHVQHTDYIEAWSLSLGRAPSCRTTTSLLLAVGSRHQEQNLAHALAN